MTTPTKESLDRAREWCHDNMPSPYAEYFIDSLAIEFDRVRLEGQIEIVNNLKGAERHEWWEMAQRLSTQLVEHPRQGTALTQPAGEEEG